MQMLTVKVDNNMKKSSKSIFKMYVSHYEILDCKLHTILNYRIQLTKMIGLQCGGVGHVWRLLRYDFREMTLYHFANCLALAYIPFWIVYKYCGLWVFCHFPLRRSTWFRFLVLLLRSEYGAFWKCIQAGKTRVIFYKDILLKFSTYFGRWSVCPNSTGENAAFGYILSNCGLCGRGSLGGRSFFISCLRNYFVLKKWLSIPTFMA